MSARLLHLLLTLIAVMAAGQNAHAGIIDCARSGTYTASSQYEKNLAELLAKLSSAAAAANGSFHSGSAGAAPPDQVWGLAMCYADRDATLCQDCLRKVASIGGVTELCPDSQGKRIRNVTLSDSDGCILRYADAPFSGSADDGWLSTASGIGGVDAGDVASMNATRWRLLSQLAERAAGRDQPRRLGYGSSAYTGARNGSQVVLYGMAQCTGDLEPRECARCLADLLVVMSSGKVEMTNATGGSVGRFSCYLRYQVNEPIDFIGGPAAAPSPQPAVPSGAAPDPPPGFKGSKAPLIAALAAAAGAVMLLVAGV